MHKVLDRLDVGNSVSAFNYPCNLLDCCHKHLLDWLSMRMIDESILKLELRACTVGHNQAVSLDNMVILWQVVIIRRKHRGHSWNSYRWICEIIELTERKVISYLPKDRLLAISPHKASILLRLATSNDISWLLYLLNDTCLKLHYTLYELWLVFLDQSIVAAFLLSSHV